MRLSLTPVRPDEHAELLHAWVTAERAVFWGMSDKPLEEVRDIYAYIDEQPHLTASLIVADDVPIGLFQTYDPFVDEIGEFYDRLPGDVGVHLLLADTEARRGHTLAVVGFLVAGLFADPAVQRIVHGARPHQREVGRPPGACRRHHRPTDRPADEDGPVRLPRATRVNLRVAGVG